MIRLAAITLPVTQKTIYVVPKEGLLGKEFEMRFLTIADFTTRKANIVGAMTSIMEFKIPKGMCYGFSSRQNMNIYVAELTEVDGDGGTTTFTPTSAPVQCPDLGGASTALEDMVNQIVVYVGGSVVTAGDIAWATSIITMDAAPGAGTLNVQIVCNSTLNNSPTNADGSAAGILEIRAEAPAGQNLGIPLFSGMLDEIQGNAQNSDLEPLRLQSAIYLPEGFVLAIKIYAAAAGVAGSETLHTAGTLISASAYAAERLRIPYQRYDLRRFPRDFPARLLASMAVS